jgi:hypothetical protein
MFKLPCAHCHAGALKSERAGFPGASVCLECHSAIDGKSAALEAVRTMARDAKPFPAHPVYTLPDFVSFSHATHGAASVKCDACHGNVAAADAVTKQTKMNMMWCVNCHKASKAPVECTSCHELSR